MWFAVQELVTFTVYTYIDGSLYRVYFEALSLQCVLATLIPLSIRGTFHDSRNLYTECMYVRMYLPNTFAQVYSPPSRIRASESDGMLSQQHHHTAPPPPHFTLHLPFGREFVYEVRVYAILHYIPKAMMMIIINLELCRWYVFRRFARAKIIIFIIQPTTHTEHIIAFFARRAE